jgi:hypothetical protein
LAERKGAASRPRWGQAAIPKKRIAMACKW